MSVKVLVADDSGTMRKIIIRSLNAVGIQDVVEAADGDEACALLTGTDSVTSAETNRRHGLSNQET